MLNGANNAPVDEKMLHMNSSLAVRPEKNDAGGIWDAEVNFRSMVRPEIFNVEGTEDIEMNLWPFFSF